MRYVIVVCFCAALLFGYVPQSFRAQSSAGVLEDAYDLLFDPARLGEISGSRVYTALSNYLTGTEQQFANVSSNVFLVGASSRLGRRFLPAGVYDRRWYSTPFFTGLFSPQGDSLFGEGRVDSTSWEDLNGNGSYDLKHVRRIERGNWQQGANGNLFLGLGVNTRRAQLGFGFAWNDSCRSSTVPWLDYTNLQYDSSLVAGTLIYREYDSSEYRQSARADNKSLILSARFGLKKGPVVGVMLQPTLYSFSSGFARNRYTLEDLNPGQPPVPDYSLSREFDTLDRPWQGTRLPLDVQVVYRQGSSAETWLSLGAELQSEALTGQARELRVATGEEVQLERWTFDDSLFRSYSGRNTAQALRASVLRRHRLGEKLDLGYALRGVFRLNRDSLIDSLFNLRVDVYDDGDSVPTRADLTEYMTSGQTWLRRTAGRQVQVALPLGLEYRVIPQIALRLGATHTLTWFDRLLTSEQTSVRPRHFRLEYGDGTFGEWLDPLETQPITREHERGISQATSFNYGIGFLPLDRLQLDLIGFANLTNLANWRLSAVFRF